MNTIQSGVINKLESIQKYRIPYEGKKLNLIKELKKIPRAGKHLRLDKSGIKLPKRSVYDHLISLGRNADIFLQFTDLKVNAETLVDFIAFHDLAEAMIGDVPYFTTSELAKGLYKTKENKDSEEKKANLLILDSFKGDIKADFEAFLSEFNDSRGTDELFLFNFIDRVDPIINIWIYINLFRSEIDIDKFLVAMDDFFLNPKVVGFSLDDETEFLVRFLQNKEFAKGYFLEGTGYIVAKSIIAGHNPNLLLTLLENEDMHFI